MNKWIHTSTFLPREIAKSTRASNDEKRIAHVRRNAVIQPNELA
jgi:hypothetical protein